MIHRQAQGFTLLELMVVMSIMALIAAIAAPQLLPALVSSGHDAEARKVAGFGQRAMEFGALGHEEVIVMIDLDEQELWCEHWTVVSDEEASFPSDALEFNEQVLTTAAEDDPDEDESQKQGEEMRSRFDGIGESRLRAQAELVIHDKEGILDEIGPLFEDEFDLDAPEIIREAIEDEFIGRMTISEDAVISSVTTSEGVVSSGLLEIIISPLGLERSVVLTVENDDGDYLEVRWNPLTMNGSVHTGDETS